MIYVMVLAHHRCCDDFFLDLAIRQMKHYERAYFYGHVMSTD
jgi:hypothetical protein